MKSEAELEQQYQMMRQQCQQFTYKINELKLDADEHDLVIEALKPLDKDRKCFRMVDAIVVERTVSDVLPAVQKNKDQVRERRTPWPPLAQPSGAQPPCPAAHPGPRRRRSPRDATAPRRSGARVRRFAGSGGLPLRARSAPFPLRPTGRVCAWCGAARPSPFQVRDHLRLPRRICRCRRRWRPSRTSSRR